jgi:hypothetical protein
MPEPISLRFARCREKNVAIVVVGRGGRNQVSVTARQIWTTVASPRFLFLLPLFITNGPPQAARILVNQPRAGGRYEKVTSGAINANSEVTGNENYANFAARFVGYGIDVPINPHPLPHFCPSVAATD